MPAAQKSSEKFCFSSHNSIGCELLITNNYFYAQQMLPSAEKYEKLERTSFFCECVKFSVPFFLSASESILRVRVMIEGSTEDALKS